MSEIDPVLKYLIEIKEDVAEIKSTLVDYPALKVEVAKQGREIVRAKASVSVIKWLAGLLLVTIPASVLAMIRIVKGGS